MSHFRNPEYTQYPTVLDLKCPPKMPETPQLKPLTQENTKGLNPKWLVGRWKLGWCETEARIDSQWGVEWVPVLTSLDLDTPVNVYFSTKNPYRKVDEPLFRKEVCYVAAFRGDWNVRLGPAPLFGAAFDPFADLLVYPYRPLQILPFLLRAWKVGMGNHAQDLRDLARL